MKKFILLVTLIGISLIGVSQKRQCNQTTILHAGTPYVNVINLNLSQTSVTFYTNEVCGATSYLWTIDGLYSMTTQAPVVTLSAWYFLWLPPNGCSGFNAKLTLYPLQTFGTYNSSLSVKSDISSSITIPVKIENVPKCETSSGGSWPSYIGPN